MVIVIIVILTHFLLVSFSLIIFSSIIFSSILNLIVSIVICIDSWIAVVVLLLHTSWLERSHLSERKSRLLLLLNILRALEQVVLLVWWTLFESLLRVPALNRWRRSLLGLLHCSCRLVRLLRWLVLLLFGLTTLVGDRGYFGMIILKVVFIQKSFFLNFFLSLF